MRCDVVEVTALLLKSRRSTTTRQTPKSSVLLLALALTACASEASRVADARARYDPHRPHVETHLQTSHTPPFRGAGFLPLAGRVGPHDLLVHLLNSPDGLVLVVLEFEGDDKPPSIHSVRVPDPTGHVPGPREWATFHPTHVEVLGATRVTVDGVVRIATDDPLH